MQSTLHRSYEALALIGVTSAVLLLGCDAAAARVEAPSPDPLPNHAMPARHDAFNAIEPAFERRAYEGAGVGRAQPVVPAAAAAQRAFTMLFPAQVVPLDAQLAAAIDAGRL